MIGFAIWPSSLHFQGMGMFGCLSLLTLSICHEVLCWMSHIAIDVAFPGALRCRFLTLTRAIVHHIWSITRIRSLKILTLGCWQAISMMYFTFSSEFKVSQLLLHHFLRYTTRSCTPWILWGVWLAATKMRVKVLFHVSFAAAVRELVLVDTRWVVYFLTCAVVLVIVLGRIALVQRTCLTTHGLTGFSAPKTAIFVALVLVVLLRYCLWLVLHHDCLVLADGVKSLWIYLCDCLILIRLDTTVSLLFTFHIAFSIRYFNKF